jgi:NitT/TauT family transport system permease protein
MEMKMRWVPAVAVIGQQILFVVVLLALWQVSPEHIVPSYFFSRPSNIAVSFGRWVVDGTLWDHLATTLVEVFVGTAIGLAWGVVSGIVLGTNRLMSRVFYPFVVLLYSLPLLALAPLFILWFGVDILPKVVLVALAVWFLIFFNTYSGARDLDQDLLAVFRIMGASGPDKFFKLIVPAAMPWIFNGIRVAVPYALSGAVIAEMLVSKKGLGLLLVRSSQISDTAGLYAVLLVIMAVGIVLSQAANALYSWVMRLQGRVI